MKCIYKYPLETTDEQVIHIPRNAVPLCVQVQAGPCMWALVDDTQPAEPRTVRVIGTGRPIPDADKLGYIGTYQLDGGALVFHVFIAATEQQPAREPLTDKFGDPISPYDLSQRDALLLGRQR